MVPLCHLPLCITEDIIYPFDLVYMSKGYIMLGYQITSDKDTRVMDLSHSSKNLKSCISILFPFLFRIMFVSHTACPQRQALSRHKNISCT